MGYSNRSGSSLHFHFDAHARAPEHVDERVEAEVADLAAHDIIQPRLRHTELLCSFALSRPAGDIANARHQLRAQLQVFRFVRREPNVEEYVAAAAGSFQFLSHRCRLSRTIVLNLARARSKSGLEVLRDFFSKACRTYTA